MHSGQAKLCGWYDDGVLTPDPLRKRLARTLLIIITSLPVVLLLHNSVSHCHLLISRLSECVGAENQSRFLLWWIGGRRRLLRKTMEDQALRACIGPTSLMVASYEGFFIHRRHIQSFVGAGVDEVVNIDQFIIIFMGSIMWWW